MSYQVPQTRIFQTFGETTTVSVSSLTPVVVAPYYDVFADYKMGEFAGVGDNYPYVGLSGDDRIVESDLTDVFTTVIKNAQAKGYPVVTYSQTEGQPGYLGTDGKSLFTGMVVANGGGYDVPNGFPALSVGDTVVQRDGSGIKAIRRIAGFQQANVSAAYTGLPTFDTVADHSESDIQLEITAGTFAPASNGVLELTITTGGTTASSNSPVRATATLNGVAVQSGIVCSPTAAATGVTGLKVKFTASKAWNVGDRVTFGIGATATASAQYDQGYSVVILDEAVTAAANDTFTLCYGAGDIVNPNGASWNQNGLVLGSSLTKNGLTILSGEVYATYRIRKNEFTEKVYTVSTRSELKALIGDVHPLNPLSVMCDLALRNGAGAGVGFVAVAFDSAAAYEKAFDAIGMDNTCWSIVPYSEDETIQRRAFSRILEFSGPSVMNWKTGWFGIDVADSETILSNFAVNAGQHDATAGDASQNLYVSGVDISSVRFGDTVVLDGAEYTVLGVFTAVQYPYIRIDSAIPTGAKTGLSVISKTDPFEKSDIVAAYAKSYNNERVRVFFADTPYLTDFPTADCPMSYLAAAWAGKRAGSAPHQPLTRSSIEGISCRGLGGFTVDNFNRMADDGVWLTVTDNDGVTYCRHQLTTKESDENYNFKEDSKVANADEITMTVRAGLDTYYGRANVTDAALEVIRLKAEQVILNVQSRIWPDLLGPQITEVESITIAPDVNFSDRVNLHITLNTPNPLNNLDIYLTIK